MIQLMQKFLKNRDYFKNWWKYGNIIPKTKLARSLRSINLSKEEIY